MHDAPQSTATRSMSPLALGDEATRDAIAAPFVRLAEQTRARLVLAHWLSALARTAIPLFVAMASAYIALRLAGSHVVPLLSQSTIVTTLLVLGLWVLLCGAAAWLKRPELQGALAVLDERRADGETFLSAYVFAGEAQGRPGELLHIQRARVALPGAIDGLPSSVPLRVRPRILFVPIALLGIALLGLSPAPQGPRAEDATLEATILGDSLDQEARVLDGVEDGLSEEERERVMRLKEEIEQSARKMADVDEGKTPRDVLEELEKRAKAAEELAAQLGTDGEQIGSAMLAELERHADTAELAGALRGQKLDTATEQAKQIARRLRNKDLSLEARKRLERAFRAGLEAATGNDLKTLLGRHLTEAQSELEKDSPDQAAEDLEELARKYQQMLQRMTAMRTLKQLAESLRTSGQRALGRNTSGMRKIEGLASAGLSKVGSQPLALSMEPTQGGRPRATAPQGTSPSPSPAGSAAPPANAPPAGTPVPGTAAPAGTQGKRAGQPCSTCGSQASTTSGQIPVPGTTPGKPGDPSSRPAGKPGGT